MPIRLDFAQSIHRGKVLGLEARRARPSCRRFRHSWREGSSRCEPGNSDQRLLQIGAQLVRRARLARIAGRSRPGRRPAPGHGFQNPPTSSPCQQCSEIEMVDSRARAASTSTPHSAYCSRACRRLCSSSWSGELITPSSRGGRTVPRDSILAPILPKRSSLTPAIARGTLRPGQAN